MEKTYFVFTDAEKIFAQDNPRVKKIYQETLGWPGNTLFRFRMFNTQIDLLKEFDYIFFFNANMRFVTGIDEDILPTEEEGLLAVQHPGFFAANNLQFSYDRNPKTHAFIPYGAGKFYVMGGFQGGTGTAFIKSIKTINEWTNDDYSKGLIPLWHDESYWNRYILDHPYKMLSPAYGFPEGWINSPFECKILILDKNKCGGHSFLRGQKSAPK